MDFKQKTPQSAEKTKKRDRPWEENQNEDVDMTNPFETDFRKIAQSSSPGRLSKTRSAGEDEDVDMDRRKRESAPAPEANENVATNRRAGQLAPAPGARDSMSPARMARKPPARLRLQRRASSIVPGFSLPPGTKIFSTPSLFTGTHAVKNSVGGIDLPIRNTSPKPGGASLANGNAIGNGDTQSRDPISSPPTQKANLLATQQHPAKFQYNWSRFAKAMLLSKQDAGAMGFDWSFSEFKNQYDYLHGVPEDPSRYMFSPDQKQQMAGIARREKAGAHGLQPSPPTLGAAEVAIVAGLPSPAAAPGVNDENQSHKRVQIGPQDDSADADLERALAMSLEDDENQPDLSVECDPQDSTYDADLKRALEMSLESDHKQLDKSTESESGRKVLTVENSPPPESSSSHLANQESARPLTPPLGSRFTSINGPRKRKLSDGSGEDQPVPSVEPIVSQRSIITSGATLAKRPTRSSGRREERAGERSDSAVANTQRLTIHPTYECCCPHCGFFGESYTAFKRHLAEHFIKHAWTEYRCPVKGCDRAFAKTELTQYMKYLEEQGLIQRKYRGNRDSLSLQYHRLRHHIKEMEKLKRKREMWECEMGKVRKMKCRIEEVEGSVIELTDDEGEDGEVVFSHADGDGEDEDGG